MSANLPASLGNSQSHGRRDFHSYSNPDQVSVRHIDLELDVLFEERTLHGIVVLGIEKVSSDVHPLVLDTMNLIIVGVEVSSDGFSYSVTPFSLGRIDPILGTPLTITLTRDANYVRIQYVTGAIAPALQWFAPGQTAGKVHPFMSTQSETIFARSWIPLQDSPQVRVTYHARVRVPPHLLAVMSAANNPQASAHGEYYFVMSQPYPLLLDCPGRRRFSLRAAWPEKWCVMQSRLS